MLSTNLTFTKPLPLPLLQGPGTRVLSQKLCDLHPPYDQQRIIYPLFPRCLWRTTSLISALGRGSLRLAQQSYKAVPLLLASRISRTPLKLKMTKDWLTSLNVPVGVPAGWSRRNEDPGHGLCLQENAWLDRWGCEQGKVLYNFPGCLLPKLFTLPVNSGQTV